MAALMGAALLAGCSSSASSVPLEDRMTVHSDVSTSRITPASRPQSEELPKRPEDPEYELVELSERMTSGERSITFAELPTSEANKTVCNAWLCEVTGEFWRWEYLCDQLLRTPAMWGMDRIDALIEGYAEGYGYDAVDVRYSSQLSTEQLYVEANVAGDALLLQPYIDDSAFVGTYDEFVNQFVAQGNRVVAFRATLTYSHLSMLASGIGEADFSAYYVLAPGAGGHLVIKNSTFYGGGSFFMGDI